MVGCILIVWTKVQVTKTTKQEVFEQTDEDKANARFEELRNDSTAYGIYKCKVQRFASHG